MTSRSVKNPNSNINLININNNSNNINNNSNNLNSININLGKLQAKSFMITDITGKVILQDNTTFSGIKTVDIKDLSKGLYFVKIKLSQGEVVKKVVVE